MGRITDDAAQAFDASKSFARGNTTVEVLEMRHSTFVTLRVSGEPIARRMTTPHWDLFSVRTGGRRDRTIKDRLNALDHVRVSIQEDGEWMLNGLLWPEDQDWTPVAYRGLDERGLCAS